MTQSHVGTNTTSSNPFAAPGDVVYFQGTDDWLLKVNSDGTDFTQIGINTTSLTRFVFSGPAPVWWTSRLSAAWATTKLNRSLRCS